MHLILLILYSTILNYLISNHSLLINLKFFEILGQFNSLDIDPMNAGIDEIF